MGLASIVLDEVCRPRQLRELREGFKVLSVTPMTPEKYPTTPDSVTPVCTLAVPHYPQMSYLFHLFFCGHTFVHFEKLSAGSSGPSGPCPSYSACRTMILIGILDVRTAALDAPTVSSHTTPKPVSPRYAHLYRIATITHKLRWHLCHRTCDVPEYPSAILLRT